MKRKTIIKKIAVLAAWLLVASGMIVLLAAANRDRKERDCKGIVVTVRGSGEKMFIEKADVLQLLKKSANGSLVNRPVVEIDIAGLERSLEKHAWISDAELWFDGRDMMHARVWEREPIARVFTTSGTSFYIDSAGQRLPILDKIYARVLVVTNFTNAKRFNAADSTQWESVRTIARYVHAHPFWKAQIAQLDVSPTGTFELTPVIGNHVIRIGNAEDLEEKLDRLFLFYKQVGKVSGFDRYAVLDVQYDGQVIGSQERYASSIDSIQLQKNIEALIQKARDVALQDSLTEIAEFNAQVHRDSTIKRLLVTLDEEAKREAELLKEKLLIDTAVQQDKKPVPKKPAPVKVKKPVPQRAKAPAAGQQQPKAVMKRAT